MTRMCAARLLAVWLTAQDEKDDVLAARYEERIIAAMMYAPANYLPTPSAGETVRVVEDSPRE